MRVGIIGLMHESNTFIPRPTTLEDFRRALLLTGEEVRRQMSDTHHEVSGFFAGLSGAGIEAVPIFFAWAMPGGAVTAEAVAALLAQMFEELEKAGPLDGLLVAPHGAGVSELEPDLDGYWLSGLRERVGPALPIVCTLDAHANLTARMVASVNATVAYRSNPHLDQRQRGLEAADLLARTLRREIRPTQAAAFPRVAINIERQYTAGPPCKPMYNVADAMLGRPGVLSNSILLGFPYSDVEEMGSAFVVVTDNDAALAQRLADELAAWLVIHRREYMGEFTDIEAALDEAAALDGSACLLDMGDNVGGGGPGDGTAIARAIQRCASGGSGWRSFVCLWDPEAATEATRAGMGSRLRLRVGGRSSPVYGPPLEADVVVRGLFAGKFSEPKVRHSGLREFDMGPTAVVETVGTDGSGAGTGLTIQLTTARTFPVSLVQLTSCGLNPASFKILVAKGVQAPVAAYSEVCRKMIRTNTRGVTDADMRRLEFKRRRRPLFPFEEIEGGRLDEVGGLGERACREWRAGYGQS